MKLTRSQQIYMGILGLFLVALTLDHTLFSPEEAGAGPGVGPGAGPGAGVVSPEAADAASPAPRGKSLKTGAKLSEAIPTVSDQLQAIARRRSIIPDEVKDAFHPSSAWFSDQQILIGDSLKRRAENFRSSHKLAAVLKGGGRVNCDHRWQANEGRLGAGRISPELIG